MASAETVCTQVECFLRDHENGNMRREDAFASWFLAQHFHLSPQEAVAQSSDRNYDGGIDGYHLEQPTDALPVLWILQAKFSKQDAIVRKGIDDLRRAVDVVAQILTVGPTTMTDEHRVVRNLRHALLRLPEDNRSRLEVKCILIHLLEDQELWLSRPAVQKAEQEFMHAVGDGPLEGRVKIGYRGPAEMVDGKAVPRRADPIGFRFEGVSFETPEAERALFGLGHLADLVELHDKYRTDLFHKNVRMYLFRQAKQPKSAATHIKKSLELICDAKMPAAHFAMIHNGVTLSVPRVSGPAESKVTLEPGQDGIFVLNGCQTVYTAWMFFKDRLTKKIEPSWRERWEAIKLPMRIVVTGNEQLVRTVTIGSNRQREIRSSAFWAHDPVQLDLERRFARQHVFYERQEGAWDHLQRSDSNLAQEFSGGPVNIEGLARSIAAAADHAAPMEWARNPNRIFDAENAYGKVFKEKNLTSVRLLLFLVNTFDATRLALLDLSRQVNKFGDLKSSKFQIPVFRLLVHWIAKNERGLVAEFANTRVPGTWSDIRNCVRQWLSHHHSGIQQILHEVWHDEDGWAEKESLAKDRMARAFRKLRLDNVFIFEGWDDFDERIDGLD